MAKIIEPRSFRNNKPRNTDSEILDFGPSLTKQADLVSSDINNIIKRYGGVPQTMIDVQYGDATLRPTDYREAMELVFRGQDAFASLPANIRNHFDNEPEKYLAFLADPKNIDKGRELGIYESVPASAPESPNPGKPGAGEGP